jgi:hypothetical protein
LFLEPGQVFGEGVRTPRQTLVALAPCQVIALDEAGVHRPTEGRLGQAGSHGFRSSKDRLGRDLDKSAASALLDDLRV